MTKLHDLTYEQLVHRTLQKAYWFVAGLELNPIPGKPALSQRLEYLRGDLSAALNYLENGQLKGEE